MAYTITTLGNSSTLVGTNGVDTATAALIVNTTTSLQVSSFDDADSVIATATGVISDSRIGMGANADTVTLTVSGFANTDVLAGDGADTINLATPGAAGITGGSIKGGGGRDTINVAFVGNNVTGAFINGNAGVDTITVTGGGGTISSSSIVGGSEGDTITVTATSIIGGRINGQVGNDIITVSATNYISMTVNGGSENDTISNTGAGAAVLSGDLGNDTINGGGVANDTMLGGGGNDTIVFAGLENATGGDGQDTFNIVAAGGTGAFLEGGASATTFDNGDTITFAAGMAVINDFSGDLLNTGLGALSTFASMNGQLFAASAAQPVSFTGEWDGSVFTIDDNGNDTLLQLAGNGTTFGAIGGVVLVNATAPTAGQVVA